MNVWRSMIVLSILGAAAAAGAAPPATSVAAGLFERDWVLTTWALKNFDTDHDILLSPAEAANAARAFRQIADGDQNGRVTPAEYRAAREFILARY